MSATRVGGVANEDDTEYESQVEIVKVNCSYWDVLATVPRRTRDSANSNWLCFCYALHFANLPRISTRRGARQVSSCSTEAVRVLHFYLLSCASRESNARRGINFFHAGGHLESIVATLSTPHNIASPTDLDEPSELGVAILANIPPRSALPVIMTALMVHSQVFYLA